MQNEHIIPIQYYCDATPKAEKLQYNLDRLSTNFSGFSVAIAPKGTLSENLHAGSAILPCVLQFKDVPSAKEGYHPLECTNITRKELVIYLMKTKVEKTLAVGGNGFRETALPCDFTADNVIQVNNNEILPKANLKTTEKPPIPDILSMRVFELGQTDIYIGDVVTAEITIIKNHPASVHYLMLKSCKAYAKSDTTKSIVLYNSSVQTPENQDIIKGTVTPTETEDNGNLTFDFYAFQFVESSNIVLECSVNVCMHSACDPTVTPPPAGRRRRSVNVLSQPTRRRRSANDEYYTASATFEVHDKSKEVKSGQQKNLPMLMVISSGLLLLYTMFQ